MSPATRSHALEGVLAAGILVVGLFGFWTSSVVTMYMSALTGAVLLPRKSLPGLALGLLVLLPTGFMRASIPVALADFVTPAVTVIAIWMVRLALVDRTIHLRRLPIRGWIIAVPFAALLVASALGTGRVGLTSAWMAVFMVCVFAPAVLGQICLDDVWPGVRGAFAATGVFLGLLAVADFMFGFNPWSAHYLRPDISPEGSVFRSLTSLGHPLTTSLVASVGLIACLFPASTGRRWPYLMGAVGSLVAIVLTVSRGAVVAIGVGLLVGLVTMMRGDSGSTPWHQKFGQGRARLMTVLTAAGAFAAVALSPFLRDRSASAIASSSAMYRSAVVENAKHIVAQRPLLGFGPGTSERVYGSHYGRFGSLENSALQLIVSIGIPAFILFVIAVCVVVVSAMRRLRAGVGAGIATFFVAAAGFNVIDTDPAFFAVISPLILCAVMPVVGARRPSGALLDSPPERCPGSPHLRRAAADYARRPAAPGTTPVSLSARVGATRTSVRTHTPSPR